MAVGSVGGVGWRSRVDVDAVDDKKRKRGKKELKKPVPAVAVKAGAPTPAEVAAAAALAAAAAATALVPAAAAPTVQRGVKHEPIKPAEVTAGSITKDLDMAGGGLVEILDRLAAAATPGIANNTRPCSWYAVKGSCKGAATQGCEKCKHGALHTAATLSAAKAGCEAKYLASLRPASLVKLAK